MSRELLTRVISIPIFPTRKVSKMAFDASNPPASPDQAREILSQVAGLLGADPDDGDAISSALSSLLEAAGLGSGADHPAADGATAHEGAMGQGPKITASAVARGRAMLGWK